MKKSLQVLWTLLVCGLFAGAAHADWNPAAYADEEILEFATVDAEGDEHWSKVWLVVDDDHVYIRLGNRAGDRVMSNANKPYVGIRVAGEEFERVLLEDAPDKVDTVATLMSEKYWSDVFIKYFAHPYTFRLVPQEP